MPFGIISVQDAYACAPLASCKIALVIVFVVAVIHIVRICYTFRTQLHMPGVVFKNVLA